MGHDQATRVALDSKARIVCNVLLGWFQKIEQSYAVIRYVHSTETGFHHIAYQSSPGLIEFSNEPVGYPTDPNSKVSFESGW